MYSTTTKLFILIINLAIVSIKEIILAETMLYDMFHWSISGIKENSDFIFKLIL